MKHALLIAFIAAVAYFLWHIAKPQHHDTVVWFIKRHMPVLITALLILFALVSAAVYLPSRSIF